MLRPNPLSSIVSGVYIREAQAYQTNAYMKTPTVYWHNIAQHAIPSIYRIMNLRFCLNIRVCSLDTCQEHMKKAGVIVVFALQNFKTVNMCIYICLYASNLDTPISTFEHAHLWLSGMSTCGVSFFKQCALQHIIMFIQCSISSHTVGTIMQSVTCLQQGFKNNSS